MKIKSPRTTFLGIANAVVAIVVVVLYVLNLINEEQMTTLILIGSTTVTTLVGILTKDEEYKKPLVDLNDPELVEFLQEQAKRAKRFKIAYNRDKKRID